MSSSSHNPAYVPGPRFGFVKLLASSGSHCTKWAAEQHRPAGFESRLVPDVPLPFISTLIGLRAFDLVSSRVWWEAATNSPRGRSRAFVCGPSSPVVGLHSVGRLTSGRFCRVCLGTGDFLRSSGQGAIPPGLYPLRGGWVYCLAPEAPQKGECRRGRRNFWPCWTRVGFGPATRPTLKTALCHIRALVGRNDE